MPFNPSAWQPSATFVQTIISSCAVIATATIGIRGLNTWRRQLTGGANLETGRKVLRAVYRVRNAALSIRSPAIFEGEAERARIDLGDKQVSDLEAAWHLRWKLLVDTMPELEAATLEAEALWGSESAQPLTKLSKAINRFGIQLGTYLQIQSYTGVRDQSYQDLHAYIYGPSNEAAKDVFKEQLDEIIKDIEKYVRPKMEGRRAKSSRGNTNDATT